MGATRCGQRGFMDSGRITCRCPFSHRCSREGQKKPQKKNTAKISKNYGKIPAVYQTFAEGASGVVRRSRWRCLGGGSAIRGSGSDQHRCRAAVETPFRRTRRLIARAAGWQRVGGSEGPASAPVSVAVAVAVVTTHPPPSPPLLPSCVLEGWRAWDGAHRMTLSRLGTAADPPPFPHAPGDILRFMPYPPAPNPRPHLARNPPTPPPRHDHHSVRHSSRGGSLRFTEGTRALRRCGMRAAVASPGIRQRGVAATQGWRAWT